MNVQIGDTVLVQPAKGIQFPAMVLHIGFQLKIDCVGFTLAGHTRFLVSVPYVESIKTLEGLDYWDFRPSQKEPEKTQAERFEGWKNPFSPVSTAEIKNQDDIKLHSSWAKPPTEGTFEWALVALKNGHKMRRSCWYEQVLVVRIEGIYPCFYSGGSVYSAHPTDLLATDWVLG